MRDILVQIFDHYGTDGLQEFWGAHGVLILTHNGVLISVSLEGEVQSTVLADVPWAFGYLGNV